MSGDVHVRFCERPGVRLPRATHLLILCRERPAAESALELTEDLLGELRLSLDPEKTRITHFDHGFRYLGHMFVRSLVLPSPNRLLRRAAAEARRAAPETPAPAATSPRPAAPESSKLRGFRPTPRDTALSRALSEALGEAGRESLLLPEASAAPAPSVRPKAPVRSAAPDAERAPSAASEPGPRRTQRAVSPFRRTLYIQEQGTVLARTEERLVVKKADEVLLEVPAAKVDQVFVFGRCSITTPAMTFCLQQEIPVILFSSRGQYYGIVDSPLADRVTLHRQQFARAADPAFCLVTAKAIVRGKLANCRVLLQRHQRRKGLEPVRAAIADLDGILARVPEAKTVEEAQGHEGYGAARYFEAFAHLLQQDLGFTCRVRRPPTDPVNSLLSFGYTLCFYNLYGLIRGRGLHPSVGYLHSMRDRHPALASDLLEEFRAPIIDSLVLYLVNARILTGESFYRSRVEGACILRDDARKTFLKHLEQKLAATVVHSRTGEAVDWRRAMDAQVAHMAQWVRGEVGEYRPLEIR